MNTRHEPIYVSSFSEHGFPPRNIDWDKKEEPMRPTLLIRGEEENVWLKAEVERLRLRPEEIDALCWCRDVLPRMWEPCAVVQIHSEFCGKMLKRLIGGGE